MTKKIGDKDTKPRKKYKPRSDKLGGKVGGVKCTPEAEKLIVAYCKKKGIKSHSRFLINAGVIVANGVLDGD